MKKILLIILVLVFAVACGSELPTVGDPQKAGIKQWDGIEEKEPKLENSTYHIYEASELLWIAKKSIDDTFENFTIKLEKDIDLVNKPFPVICPSNDVRLSGVTTKKAFRGNFEGNNKMIMNVNIGNLTNERQAFIGNMANGTIKNLILTNGTVVGKDYVAGFVAYILAITGSDKVTLENCTTYLDIKSESDIEGIYIGGISAKIDGKSTTAGGNLQILTSTNYGTITFKRNTEYRGAIFARATSSIISNCKNYYNSPTYDYGSISGVAIIYEDNMRVRP